MRRRWIWPAIVLGLAVTAGALAQQTPSPPTGQAVFNQGRSARAVTPSDTTILNGTRAIFNGGASACNIALILAQDSAAVTFANVQAGEILPVTAIKVMSTNTSCSNIVALY